MYQCGKRGISGCAFILVSFWGISGGSAGAQPGSVGTVVAFFLEVLYHHRVNHYHIGELELPPRVDLLPLPLPQGESHMMERLSHIVGFGTNGVLPLPQGKRFL